VQELETNLEVMIRSSLKSFINTLHINDLAAPQGFEPRYADPESGALWFARFPALVRTEL